MSHSSSPTLSTDRLPISLVIISLNEEASIQRCIRSSTFVDDVVVLDSGSVDQTREVAAALGARVFHEAWRGFGPQKQRATELAKNDWILSLDCDEELSQELIGEIRERFVSLDPRVGYKVPRLSYYLGRWIRHGGWYPDYQLRLFNRKFSRWSDAPIHESVISPEISRLEHPLHHFVFKTLSEQVQTNDRYSGLQAEEAISKGARFSPIKIFLKPASKFLECYFLKLGFLDGWPGFIIAVSAGYSMFLRWSKIWEQQNVRATKNES